ncbi:MAG: alpha/beta fold hydrolase [Rhizobiales bacterium]|nr:alpha/beta fold hydrolase [Hyphomicrobiales bacterium]
MNDGWHDIFFTVRDGLRLHARHYPAHASPRRPLVCLPGLTRNARDFHRIAERLSDPNRHRRAVYALDYRGRGLSDHDPDWKNYSPYIEALDVLDFLSMQRLHDVAILGTSRGGIIAMIIATLRPTAIGAAILNDIGPVIERDGLARIIGYVGKVPVPETWQEARDLVREMNRRDFPSLSNDDWMAVARQMFNDDNGAPASSYDRALSRAFSNLDLEGPIPQMWPQFRALARNPVLAIRGANSDILSEATLERMVAEAPDLRAHRVAGEGHAPLLRDAPTITAIEEFLFKTDERRLGHLPSATVAA